MAQKSLYDVLLVDQNASLDEIKLAFKRRALQVHPDKGGSKEEFHLVYEALETLGDPAARQKYDHILATGSKKTEAAPHPKPKKRKKAGQHVHPPTSCKAETKKEMRLERSQQLLLARLQVDLRRLQQKLRQQNCNLRRPSC